MGCWYFGVCSSEHTDSNIFHGQKKEEHIMSCAYCERAADGPMLRMGAVVAHARCVADKLRELVDPDWEPGRQPSPLPGFLCGHKEGGETQDKLEERYNTALAQFHEAELQYNTAKEELLSAWAVFTAAKVEAHEARREISKEGRVSEDISNK